MRRGLKQHESKFSAMAGVGFLVLTIFSGGQAQATEGYFQHGYGARQQALGGAGVADSRDAMALSLNPAGIVDVGHQFQAGASLFAPFRDYTATGTAFTAQGTVDSGSNYFVVPNLAYSRPIDLDSAWGLAVFGNGGMNTNYGNVANTTGLCAFIGTQAGVFCRGPAGVDLMQAFISAGYARRFGAVSIGVAPVFAIQRFKADGLAAFAGISSDTNNLTNNGYDWSFGGGVRGGVQVSLASTFRVGLSGQTPMWMTRFDKYRGLFAEQGDFDIPGNFTVGVAWDAMPTLTLMADYKRIFYGSVAAVANPMASPGLLGADDGLGFGWHDVDVFKFGVEWRYSPTWTFRAGYAHNTNPIQGADIVFNILAPGVVTDHFSGGFSYKMTEHSTLELAGTYVPRHSLSAVETLPAAFGGATAGSNVTIGMDQYQITVGWTYKFGEKPAPKKALIYK